MFTITLNTMTSGPARGFSNDKKPSQHNVREPTFQVFNDENQSPTVFPPQSGEWGSVPGRSGSNRENEQQPGKWTDAKVHMLLPIISGFFFFFFFFFQGKKHVV